MFNGIVKKIGTVISVERESGGVACVIDTHLKRRFSKGESVLVDGVCSTVTSVKSSRLTFFFMEETLEKTTARSYAKGTQVNIEPSLRVGDDLSGHIISGHVDGIGTIQSIDPHGKMSMVTVGIPSRLSRYVVPKGSVAINGVSLTVVKCSEKTVSIALVPYTFANTTWALKKKGDSVNVETDLTAKYIERLYGKNKT